MSSIRAAEHFLPYYRTGQRIRVLTDYGNNETYVRTGTVSRTTGWIPSLMLMHRSNDIGSSDLLDGRDVIVAVQRNGRYVTVETCQGRGGHGDPRCGRQYGHTGPCDWTD